MVRPSARCARHQRRARASGGDRRPGDGRARPERDAPGGPGRPCRPGRGRAPRERLWTSVPPPGCDEAAGAVPAADAASSLTLTGHPGGSRPPHRARPAAGGALPPGAGSAAIGRARPGRGHPGRDADRPGGRAPRGTAPSGRRRRPGRIARGCGGRSGTTGGGRTMRRADRGSVHRERCGATVRVPPLIRRGRSRTRPLAGSRRYDRVPDSDRSARPPLAPGVFPRRFVSDSWAIARLPPETVPRKVGVRFP